MTSERQCRKCGAVKPIEEYYPRGPAYPGKRNTACKPCHNQPPKDYGAAYRAELDRLGWALASRSVTVMTITRETSRTTILTDRQLTSLLRRIKVGPACWEWQGHQTEAGYGIFSFGHSPGTGGAAHRIVYQVLVGPIDDGLTLDHLCRNPSCVNPEHLDPCTMSVNTRRAPIGGRGEHHRRKTTCPQGHPYDHTDGEGRRRCRACVNALARARYHRRKRAGADNG